MSLTTVQPGMLGTPQPYNFKNRFINGNMAVWQRGTSFSATVGAYLADRWVSNQVFTCAQSTDVPTGTAARYSMQNTMTAGQYGTIQQRIESINCNDMSGQTVTISFYAKVSTGSTSLYVQLYYANTADTFSSTTQIGSTQVQAITSSWVKYSFTFTSLSANSVNGLMFQMYSDGSACTYRATNFQLELGSTATDFDYRPYGLELQLCQRYYEQFGNGWWCSGETTNYNVVFGGSFLVPKRVNPTCSLLYTDIVIYQFGVSNRNGSGCSIISSSQMYTWGGQIKVAGWSTITTGQLYGGGGSVGSGYQLQPMAASAEL